MTTDPWRKAKSQAIANLAARYGFYTTAEMRAVLAKWQAATGRPPITLDRLHDNTRTERQAKHEHEQQP